ncbi:hypothetical protein D3C71_1246950 [compost metagenome]
MANLRIGKIRKLTTSGPHKSFHKIIVPSTTKIFIFFPFPEHPVVLINLNTRIDHHHGFKTIIGQIADHIFRIGEILLIPGKTAVPFHVIDIKVNSITWNLSLPKLLSNLPDIRFGIIAPATLVVTNCPQRRQVMRTCQRMITTDNIDNMRTVDIVVLQFPTFGPKACFSGIFGSEIKIRFKGIVKENAVGLTVF